MANEYTLAVTQLLPDGTLKLYFAPSGGAVALGDEHPEEIMAKVAKANPKDVDPALAAKAVIAMQAHHKDLSNAVADLTERHAELTSAVAELEAAPDAKR